MPVLKNLLKEASFRVFRQLDSFGVHVLPKHFYTPVPDQAWLRANRALWARRTSMIGVGWDLDRQLDWLRDLCRPYYGEVERLELFQQIQSSGVGTGYGPIESQVLHCFMRSMQPRQIIEVGSGVSTVCMLKSIERNRLDGGPNTSIVSIEPYPKPAFASVPEIRHIRQLCQEVPVSVFDELGPGDLLFIDSSHVVKTGSEVPLLYLEILPRLKPGVFVHIHDIYLPYLYSGQVLKTYMDPQETTLLLALLSGNPRFHVLACLSALHYDRTAELGRILKDYRPQQRTDGLQSNGHTPGHFPSSTWLRVEEAG